MKLTHALLGEHGVIYALFDWLEAALPGMSRVDQVRDAASVLGAALLSHAALEDELLFPALESRIGPAGPLSVMRHEHTEIDRAISEAARAEVVSDGVGRLREALEVARAHFAKEEHVLFHLAQQALGDPELLELGEAWAERRKVHVA
jgi:hemerythrin-like domain-containing protein